MYILVERGRKKKEKRRNQLIKYFQIMLSALGEREYLGWVLKESFSEEVI